MFLVGKVKKRNHTLFFAAAFKYIDAASFLMAVDPLETICFIIFFPESRVFQIQFIQVFHETGESSMKWIIQKHPVLLAFFIPFTELADFISHEI